MKIMSSSRFRSISRITEKNMPSCMYEHSFTSTRPLISSFMQLWQYLQGCLCRLSSNIWDNRKITRLFAAWDCAVLLSCVVSLRVIWSVEAYFHKVEFFPSHAVLTQAVCPKTGKIAPQQYLWNILYEPELGEGLDISKLPASTTQVMNE